MANAQQDRKPQISAGLIGLVVVGVLLLIFIFQNTQDETVEIFFWDVEAPMWVILLGTAVVAIALAELGSFIRRHRRRR
jgi:uncharacterized integral membrane protein